MLLFAMVKRFASDRRLVAALSLLAAYLVVLYAAIRWDIRPLIAIPAATKRRRALPGARPPLSTLRGRRGIGRYCRNLHDDPSKGNAGVALDSWTT